MSITFAFGGTVAAQSIPNLGMASLQSGSMRMMLNLNAASDPTGAMMIAVTFEDATFLDNQFATMADSFGGSFFSGEHTSTPINGLGDAAVEMTGQTGSAQNDLTPADVALAQDGTILFGAMVLGGNNTSTLTTDIASFMVNADPSDTPVTFDDAGASTGGVFDRMPTSADIAENSTNTAPTADHQFVIVRLKAEYHGDAEGDVLFISFDAVGQSGHVSTTFDNDGGVLPDTDLFATRMKDGDTQEVNVCWSIPTNDIDGLVVEVSNMLGLTRPDPVRFSLDGAPADVTSTAGPTVSFFGRRCDDPDWAGPHRDAIARLAPLHPLVDADLVTGGGAGASAS